jgi:hypothetical protein
MSRPRDDRQDDLFRPALRDIIDLHHPLVRLVEETDWEFVASGVRNDNMPPTAFVESRGTDDD